MRREGERGEKNWERRGRGGDHFLVYKDISAQRQSNKAAYLPSLFRASVV